MSFASPIRLLPLLCISSALAEEVQVTATGVVIDNVGIHVPYDGVALGSEVKLTFRVTTPGNVISNQTGYTIIPETWRTDFEGAPPLFMPAGNAVDLIVSDGTSQDYFYWPSTTIEQGIAAYFLSGLPPSAFDTSDVTQLAGLYTDILGSSWLLFGQNIGLSIELLSLRIHPPFTGVNFCDPMSLNSTGDFTRLLAHSVPGQASGVHLEVSHGPPHQFGYFLIGTAAIDPGIPVSDGRMCLSPGFLIGRYNLIGTTLNSIGQFDASGVLHNLSQTSVTGTGFDVPQALPFVAGGSITAGETWHFQFWHRENLGRANFSNGVSVTF